MSIFQLLHLSDELLAYCVSRGATASVGAQVSVGQIWQRDKENKSPERPGLFYFIRNNSKTWQLALRMAAHEIPL